jgi:hypothetical protein
MRELHELVMEGSLPVLKAFLAGLAAGQNQPWEIRFSSELDVHEGSLGHKLLERLQLERDTTRVIVPSTLLPAITHASERAQAEMGVGVRVAVARAIRAAVLAYRFEIFSREAAHALRTALGALPEGVALHGASSEERGDPERDGVAVYTPEHTYVLRGRGEARGPLEGVLRLRAALSEIEQVDCGTVCLETAEDEAGGA